MKGNGQLCVSHRHVVLEQLKHTIGCILTSGNCNHAFVSDVTNRIIWYNPAIAATHKEVLQEVSKYFPEFNCKNKLLNLSLIWELPLDHVVFTAHLMRELNIIP